MNFKVWLVKNDDMLEMADIRNTSTDDVKLEPLSDDDFDENEAEANCDHELRFNDYRNAEVYDVPEDDPSFTTESPSEWRHDNPPPDKHDYENWEKDEDYIKDLESWKQEKAEVEQQYKVASDAWEKEMKPKRYKAEDEESNARYEAIQNCVEEKRAEWEKENGGFKSKFNHQGDDFEVSLARKEIKYANEPIPHCYEIEFSGANDFATTGKAGMTASSVYTKLLLVIKKLMDTHEVNGLIFRPSEPGMATIYNRFFDKFLKRDFVKVSDKECVKKAYIRSLQFDPRQKQATYFQRWQAGRTVQSKLKTIKANRELVRHVRKLSQVSLGNVVQTTDGFNIYVAQISDSGQPIVQGISDRGGVIKGIKLPVQYVTTNLSTPENTKTILSRIVNDPDWSETIEEVNPKTFRPLLQKYGLHPS
jgi:hypothetical protein